MAQTSIAIEVRYMQGWIQIRRLELERIRFLRPNAKDPGLK